MVFNDKPNQNPEGSQVRSETWVKSEGDFNGQMIRAGDRGMGFVSLLESGEGGMMGSLNRLHEAHASMAPKLDGGIARLGFSEAREGVNPSGEAALLFAANQKGTLDGGSFDRMMNSIDSGIGLNASREVAPEVPPEVAPEVDTEVQVASAEDPNNNRIAA